METLEEEADLFARAMSGLAEDDGNAADEDHGTRDGGRAAKKRPREAADIDEYDSEGRMKERRVVSGGESGAKSSSKNGVARADLENKFRIPSPPR